MYIGIMFRLACGKGNMSFLGEEINQIACRHKRLTVRYIDENINNIYSCEVIKKKLKKVYTYIYIYMSIQDVYMYIFCF